MSFKFYSAWGAPHTFDELSERYPGLCVKATRLPQLEDMVLATLWHDGSSSSFDVGSRLASWDELRASRLFPESSLANLMSGLTDIITSFGPVPEELATDITTSGVQVNHESPIVE